MERLTVKTPNLFLLVVDGEKSKFAKIPESRYAGKYVPPINNRRIIAAISDNAPKAKKKTF